MPSSRDILADLLEAGEWSASDERGALCVRTGAEQWRTAGPTPPRPLAGAVAVVADSNAIAAAVCAALLDRGVGSSFTAVLDTEGQPGLAALIDLAARHRDTAAIVVAFGHVDVPARLVEVADAVRPHLPVLYWPYRRPEPLDPWFDPWVQRLGGVVFQALGPLADAAAVAGRLDTPAGDTVTVVAPSRAGAQYVAAAFRARGWISRLDVGGPDPDPWIARLEAAAEDTASDALVAWVPELRDPHAAAALAARVADVAERNPDIGLLVLSSGDAATRATLREHLGSTRVPVLATDAAFAEGWSALRRWRGQPAAMASAPRVADVGRARRAIDRWRRQPEAAFDPAVQADLLGGLGLPAVAWRRVPYLEDALLTTGDIGFPAQLAVFCADQGWDAPPEATVVRNSEQLLAAGQQLLADAQRRTSVRAELLVARAVDRPRVVVVVARRHPRWGPVLEWSCDGARAFGVGPQGEGALGIDDPLTAEGARHAANALLGLLHALPELTGVRVELVGFPGGFVTQHAAVTEAPQAGVGP